MNTSVVLFANDTSVIINESNFTNLERKLNMVFKSMKEWFNSNMLSLNLGKTYCMQFSTKYNLAHKLYIEYDNKLLLESSEIKFLGITLENIMSWKKHIDTITGKLNKACYIIKKSKLYLSNDALHSEIHKLINCIWSKEESPDQ
jgi:protein associated with RNAse G/E